MLHGFVRGKFSLAWRALSPRDRRARKLARGCESHRGMVSSSQRALVVGIFNAGSSLGSALAPPVVAYLTLAYGWRSGFVFIGAVGLVWMAVCAAATNHRTKNRFLSREEYLEIKDHVRRAQRDSARIRQHRNWRKVMGMRECYTLIIAASSPIR